MVIPLPYNVEFEEWVNLLITVYPKKKIPLAKKDWKEWAELISIPGIFPKAPLPTTLMYKEENGWRDWAMNFIQTQSA